MKEDSLSVLPTPDLPAPGLPPSRLPMLEPVYARLQPLAYPLVRIATGAFLMPHGAQKLFGFAGGNIAETAAGFAKLGGVSPLEVSSGRRHEHRLNRTGDRQLNRALHAIAKTRLDHDDRTAQVVGRVTRSNSAAFPYVLVDAQNNRLFINAAGGVFDGNGRQVALVSDPS